MIDAQSFGMGIGVGMMISAIAMPVIYIGFTKAAPGIDRIIRQFRMAAAKSGCRAVEATMGQPDDGFNGFKRVILALERQERDRIKAAYDKAVRHKKASGHLRGLLAKATNRVLHLERLVGGQ